MPVFPFTVLQPHRPPSTFSRENPAFVNSPGSPPLMGLLGGVQGGESSRGGRRGSTSHTPLCFLFSVPADGTRPGGPDFEGPTSLSIETRRRPLAWVAFATTQNVSQQAVSRFGRAQLSVVLDCSLATASFTCVRASAHRLHAGRRRPLVRRSRFGRCSARRRTHSSEHRPSLLQTARRGSWPRPARW